jgi:hypothetical protein
LRIVRDDSRQVHHRHYNAAVTGAAAEQHPGFNGKEGRKRKEKRREGQVPIVHVTTSIWQSSIKDWPDLRDGPLKQGSAVASTAAPSTEQFLKSPAYRIKTWNQNETPIVNASRNRQAVLFEA